MEVEALPLFQLLKSKATLTTKTNIITPEQYYIRLTSDPDASSPSVFFAGARKAFVFSSTSSNVYAAKSEQINVSSASQKSASVAPLYLTPLTLDQSVPQKKFPQMSRNCIKIPKNEQINISSASRKSALLGPLYSTHTDFAFAQLSRNCTKIPKFASKISDIQVKACSYLFHNSQDLKKKTIDECILGCKTWTRKTLF